MQTQGETMGCIWGFASNSGAFLAFAAPVFKRLRWPVSTTFFSAVGVCFALALAWMMFCDWLYQKRIARKKEQDYRFLFLFHFAPTAVIYAAKCLLFLWATLVH